MTYAVVCKLPQGIALGSTTIRGTAVERNPAVPRPDYLIYGYALTEDVPDQVWEPWISANAKSLLVLNHMIFGSKDLMEARRFAYQHLSASRGMSHGAPQGTVAP